MLYDPFSISPEVTAEICCHLDIKWFCLLGSQPLFIVFPNLIEKLKNNPIYLNMVVYGTNDIKHSQKCLLEHLLRDQGRKYTTIRCNFCHYDYCISDIFNREHLPPDLRSDIHCICTFDKMQKINKICQYYHDLSLQDNSLLVNYQNQPWITLRYHSQHIKYTEELIANGPGFFLLPLSQYLQNTIRPLREKFGFDPMIGPLE